MITPTTPTLTIHTPTSPTPRLYTFSQHCFHSQLPSGTHILSLFKPPYTTSLARPFRTPLPIHSLLWAPASHHSHTQPVPCMHFHNHITLHILFISIRVQTHAPSQNSPPPHTFCYTIFFTSIHTSDSHYNSQKKLFPLQFFASPTVCHKFIPLHIQPAPAHLQSLFPQLQPLPTNPSYLLPSPGKNLPTNFSNNLLPSFYPTARKNPHERLPLSSPTHRNFHRSHLLIHLCNLETPTSILTVPPPPLAPSAPPLAPSSLRTSQLTHRSNNPPTILSPTPAPTFSHYLPLTPTKPGQLPLPRTTLASLPPAFRSLLPMHPCIPTPTQPL